MTKRRKKNTLNLDELFGQAKDLVVIWEGARHMMRHPTAMGPKDLNLLQRLQDLQVDVSEDMKDEAKEDEAAEELIKVIDKIIGMIAPTLDALGLPIFAKMRIMTFYQKEIEAENPKAAAGVAKQTGETSTPA